MTDPSELADERVNVVALAGMTLGLWCGVGCLIGIVSVHRRKTGDVVWQRKRYASARPSASWPRHASSWPRDGRWTPYGRFDRPWWA